MKKIIAVISLIAMFVLGSCATIAVSAEQNNPVKIWGENTNGLWSTMIVIDENTGVNYIVVAGHTSSRGANSISITPRLNADGTLYISK